MLWHISSLKRTWRSPRGVMSWRSSWRASARSSLRMATRSWLGVQVREISPFPKSLDEVHLGFLQPAAVIYALTYAEILLSLVHLAIVTFAGHFAWESTLNRERCLCQEKGLWCSSGDFLMLTSVRLTMWASKYLSINRKRICDREMSGLRLEVGTVFLLQMGTNCSDVARPFVARIEDFCMPTLKLGRSL